MADRSDNLRASDADRQVVAERLRAAHDEGRLDLAEYDARLNEAYAAKTYGDLKALLVDLPSVTPAVHSQMEPSDGARQPVPAGTTTKWIAAMWSTWLSTALIMIAIWMVSSLASGEPQYFWPIWVIGPWGVVLLAGTIKGVAEGQPRLDAQRQARKRARRYEERQRRRLEWYEQRQTERDDRRGEPGR